MNEPFYQVKGALPADAPSYIKRDADDMLYNALIEHKYCYVLNYRQVGKSSLKNSCSKRLEEVGHRCVHIDLTSIGSKDIEVEKWYFSFMFTIVRQLNLSEIALLNYWFNEELTVVSRVGLIIDELILKECSDEITIFIDEIDYILSINKFNTDNFFALIRSFYNLRGEDERYNRLTFVLLGVASPNDLMQDSSRTPFNIAENIKISQLKFEQSFRLMDGLGNQTIDKKEILKKVFEYTSGTSFLTQKILEDVAKYPIASLDDINSIVDRLFVQEGFNEVNLSNIQARIIQNKTHNVKMLYTIEQIQNGAKIEDDSRRHTYIYLKLSGLIKVENGLLVYSNLIYQKIFNAIWLDKMIDKLDRPIVKYFQKWMQNNKSDEYLLKEEALQEVAKWAYHRHDLLATEYNYLSISHQEESRKSRIKLEKEAKELNNKLLKEQKKSNKKLLKQKKIISGVFILAFLFSIGGGYYYINLKKEKYKIENIKYKIEKEKLEIKNQKLKLELKKKNVLLKSDLKEDSIEFYKQKIDAYEYLDNLDKTQIKYRKEIIKASIKLGERYKDNNKSQHYYLKAIDLYKEDNNTYEKEIANIYYKIALRESSLKYFDKAMKIYNKNPITYRIKRAEIYYSISDIAISEKDIRKAERYYKEGFEIYKKLLQDEPSKYINILADSFYKQAKIYELKNNKKKAYIYYKKALNIYIKLDSKLYQSNIKKIKDKLKKIKNFREKYTKPRKFWVYIGKFIDGEWEKQYFWLQNLNTTKLKNSDAIAISNITLRERPSEKAKKLGGSIPIGDIVTILKIEPYPLKDKSKKGNYIWAFIKY